MIYRAMWEIRDIDRPRSVLIAEASGALDAMAAKDGARITGEPTWTVAGETLMCEAPADLMEPVTLTREERDVQIVRLAGLGWTARQISATTGVPVRTVRDVMLREGFGEGS